MPDNQNAAGGTMSPDRQMKTKRMLWIGLLVLPLLALSLASVFGGIGLGKTTTIKGIVSKVEWMSPNARLYISVPESDGTITHWTIKMMRIDWSRNTVQQGDQIRIDGIRLRRTGPKVGYTLALNWSDGFKVIDVHHPPN